MVERDLGQFLGAKPIVDLNCLDLRPFPPEFLFLFSLSEAERGFGAIFRCGADCRSKLPTPPNETSVPVFQLWPFVAETSFETSVNNDSPDLGKGSSPTCPPNGELMEAAHQRHCGSHISICANCATLEIWVCFS